MAKKTTTTKTPQTAIASEPELLPVKDLYLDPKNPRLASSEVTMEDQDGILRILWRERAVNEIADSIAASGFWTHEMLFATQENGKWVVIEGNRRLAAVKLLRDPALAKRIGVASIPLMTSVDREKLAKLPVVKCTRESIWQYVGFKHVNGPQDWDSVAKAEYVARLHNDLKIDLEKIATTIGDRHETVKRMYRGLMVLKQAESEGVFDRKNCYSTRFAYSHLWTGLGYESVQEFLGLKSSGGYKPNPVPKAKVSNLGELMLWLYGDKKAGKKPVVRSQNPDLRNLVTVLRSAKGVAALRKGLPLTTSVDISKGDEQLLRESMVEGEAALRKAVSYVPTGYGPSKPSDLRDTAKTIRKLAESLDRAIYTAENDDT
ncbi:MAG: hypothetical protein FJ280_16390 [Planctomycetes bacterium]|nr:hypothetical protein [Planctomycetota bacterium]